MVPQDDHYRIFLALSGSAIARFEMHPPLDGAKDEAVQIQHIVRDGRIAECNEVFASLYGKTAAELTGHSLAEFIPKGDPARLEGIRQFIRGGYRLIGGEEVHKNMDGTTRVVAGSAIGVVVDGRLTSYWLTLDDVTARRRAEEDRERRGRILEAVAFGAARLLESGAWGEHAHEVLARLGHATGVSRAYIAEVVNDPDESPFMTFRVWWTAPGIESLFEDAQFQGRIPMTGLEPDVDELRAGRAVVRTVGALSTPARDFLARFGTRSFAAVPIAPEGKLWGFLGMGETRFDRVFSAIEIEALRAASAVLGAAMARDRAGQEARESEKRFERLAAAAFEGIAITEDGVVLDANEQLAALLGYPLPEILGRPATDLIAPQHREMVAEHSMRGAEEAYQHNVLRKDGAQVPVEVRARSLPHRGRTVRVTAIRDVSERLLAEERQRQLEAGLRRAADEWSQTFDALDLGIVLTDSGRRIARLNRGALDRLAESGFKDAVGLTLDEMAATEPWRTLRDLQHRVEATRRSQVGEAEDATGRSYYLLTSPWTRGPGERPWCVLTFRDVTQFVAMQSQLRRARTMEAMGSLVAGVAHEVRNPLFSISATVDALETELGSRPEFPESAAILRTQVNRLSQLMRDLLDYGKPAGLHRAPTRLPDVARRALRSCASLVRERGVTVVEEFAPDLPTLDVDSTQIEQALQNLVANAVQHSPAGSEVRLAGRVDRSQDKVLALCVVEDQGPGLAADHLPRVFEPFFSRRKGGTGLGLPIVQRVAEAHGGQVIAENRAEGGARFTLVLPVEDAPAAPAAGGRDA